jgi:cytochrome c553
MKKEQQLSAIVTKKLNELDKKELIKEVKELREQNKSLKDEKESLWMMLDELSESDIENWSHLLDQLEAKAVKKTLVRGLPVNKTNKD